MAYWSTFYWSDGTLWSDRIGVYLLYTAFIDKSTYRVSLRIKQTVPSGSTTAPSILTLAAECGPRAQLDTSHIAFLDINDNTQYVSVIVRNTFALPELTTEDGISLTTEAGVVIVAENPNPFTIDLIHLLANQRSRSQPVG